MAVVHIPEEDAIGLGPILAKVRAGEEVVIDSGNESFAVTRVSSSDLTPAPKRRSLSEALRRAEECDSQVTLDDQFGNDLEAIIRQHDSSTVTLPAGCADSVEEGIFKHRPFAEILHRAEKRNSPLTLDDQFGNDLEAVIRQHQQEARFDPWE